MNADVHEPRFYCSFDTNSKPTELTRCPSENGFKCKLPVPLPKHMVVYTLGKWDSYSTDARLDITVLSDKKEPLHLGQLTPEHRCWLWEGNSDELMHCKKGDKKINVHLVVITPAMKISTENVVMEMEVVEESVQSGSNKSSKSPDGPIQKTKSPKVEPSTPVETKVKSASNGGKAKRARMGDKTPDGPASRKQKTSTRTRALKDMLNTYKPSNQTPDTKPLVEETPVKTESTDAEMQAGTVVVATSMAPSPSSGKAKVPVPSCRWGHTMTLVSDRTAVLIGGQGGDKNQICKDAIWSLTLEQSKWKALETTTAQGPKPEARMGHTASFDPTLRCIYVFGGSKKVLWFNDVHILNVDNFQWQLVKANGKAPTRAYHSSNLFRHELWIFGGVFPMPDPQPDASSNDIHVFNPMDENWYTPIVMGERPTARSGHSATLIEDKMVMFGGWDFPVCFNELYVLDMGIVEWNQPSVKGTPPSPRSWHSSCALSGARVLIHGGYNGDLPLHDSFIFDLDTLSWIGIQLNPPIPSRCGHAALCSPYRHDKNNDKVVIFGGGDNDGSFFDDLLEFLVPITVSPNE